MWRSILKYKIAGYTVIQGQLQYNNRWKENGSSFDCSRHVFLPPGSCRLLPLHTRHNPSPGHCCTDCANRRHRLWAIDNGKSGLSEFIQKIIWHAQIVIYKIDERIFLEYTKCMNVLNVIWFLGRWLEVNALFVKLSIKQSVHKDSFVLWGR